MQGAFTKDTFPCKALVSVRAYFSGSVTNTLLPPDVSVAAILFIQLLLIFFFTHLHPKSKHLNSKQVLRGFLCSLPLLVRHELPYLILLLSFFFISLHGCQNSSLRLWVGRPLSIGQQSMHCTCSAAARHMVIGHDIIMTSWHRQWPSEALFQSTTVLGAAPASQQLWARAAHARTAGSWNSNTGIPLTATNNPSFCTVQP